jgi:hypothetical protein
LLCEPVAFSPDAMASRPRGEGPGDGGNFMSQIARKRRTVWPDRDAVLASYRSRPPFDVLAPESLAAYVRWGFVDRADGQVELACPPQVEATIFEVSGEPPGAPAAWRHLDAMTAPTTVARGDHSDLPSDWFALQAARAGGALVTLPGGHFFLQEDTARAEQLVRDQLIRDSASRSPS